MPANEQPFGPAFDFAAIGMALLAPDSRVLAANRALCEMLGYTQEQLRDLPPHALSHAADWQQELVQRNRLLTGVITYYNGEHRLLHDVNGTIRYWSAGAWRMFRFSSEQAVGQTFVSLMGPGAGLPAPALAELVATGRWTGELDCMDATGRLLVVERRCTVMRGAEGEAPESWPSTAT